jgi:putative DNA-invertase from lambdoid prophage Rac
MAVYGYTRVSTALQVDGTSLGDQRRRIVAIADFHGWTIEEMFEDRGVSGGTSLHERPMGHALVAKLQPGDTLVVSKMDRLFRSAEDAVRRTNVWAKVGVHLVVGDISTDPVTKDGVGRLFFTILAAMAEFERSRIAERVNAGKEAKRAAGGFAGGKPPFGYIVEGKGKFAKLMPHPQLFPVRARIAAMRMRGSSFREIQAAVMQDFPIRLGLATITKVCKDSAPEASFGDDRTLPPPLPFANELLD